MSAFGERLARLMPSPMPTTPSLRAQLRARARRAAERGLADLPGGLEETPEGPLFVRRKTLPRSHRHGGAPLDAALEATGETMAALALDPALAGFDPARAVYLDTETTGLSGGTGTLPFLVGYAWFEDGRVLAEQTFLRDPSDEPVALHALARRLSAATHLVTFNGKAFDWPLLATRFVLARIPLPGPRSGPLPHLDLLHVARRVWRRRLGDCRLTALEAEVLGFVREGDVPGSMIPGLYLDFLCSGTAEPLAGVFEHNMHDLVAMVALVGCLAQAWANPEGVLPEDLCSLARVALRARDRRRAIAFLEAAGDRRDALRMRARLCRKEEPATARDLLELCLPEDDDGGAHLDLAKLLEHGLRDPAAALEVAREAGRLGAESEPGARRREERLERKVARSG